MRDLRPAPPVKAVQRAPPGRAVLVLVARLVSLDRLVSQELQVPWELRRHSHKAEKHIKNIDKAS